MKENVFCWKPAYPGGRATPKPGSAGPRLRRTSAPATPASLITLLAPGNWLRRSSGRRFDVDQHVLDAHDLLKQTVFDIVRDCVTGADGDIGIHLDVDVHQVFQPGLARQQLFDAQDTRDAQGFLPDALQNI